MSLSTPTLPSIESNERSRLRELYVQKKWEHDGVSHALTKVIQEELQIPWVTAEVYDKYYVQGGDAQNGLSDDEFELARKTIFAELPLENTLGKNDFYGRAGKSEIIDIADVPGQFSQRTDSVEKSLLAQWQIVLQYLDADGNPTNAYNGSAQGVAGICSPDGRILGLMPHPERSGLNVFKNVPGNKHLGLFDGAAEAFGVKPKYRRTSRGVLIREGAQAT